MSGNRSRIAAVNRLAAEIETQLVEQHGAMLSGRTLYTCLGYRNAETFRQHVAKGTVPIHVFNVEGRRGKHGLARDVARWLAEVRVGAEAPITIGKDSERR